MADSIYDNPWVVQTVNRCRMGDTVAMLDMAYFFKERCSPTLRELIDVYEKEPTYENYDPIFQYHRFRAETEAKAYGMWLVRASLYGNREAERIVSRLEYYKYMSFVSYGTMVEGEPSTFNVWSSDTLLEIGWMGAIPGKEECGLTYHKKKGYYAFWYLADYDAPDEYGFGAEWNYDTQYFDEFFYPLSAKKEREAADELQRIEKIREEYWNDLDNDAAARKYRRRP